MNASPTSPMRSVAAPRLNMSSFVISVEHKDPAGCRESTRQATATRQTNIWVSIDTILARWNRPRPAMTCLKAGGSYSCSPAIRIIDYNTTTLTSYSAVLRCHLDDDVLASAAIFRRRRHIPRTSLVASPAPFIPPRLPRNHAHETGGMIRRDGELASWRRGGVLSSSFFCAVLAR